ncbi:MAG: dihydroxyacetone kinase phosphoryl donor subunit DhaM [Acidithiobacillus sp.]|nr:dihydroxyacetone kinase phosphoryl donor subunit DhaM [Acidithiobacillus sp.]
MSKVVSTPVALLLVSHSRALAEATEALLRQVVGDSVRIAVAAGAGEAGGELGTDATRIAASLSQLAPQSVLVLMDLGSAVLSAQMALEFLPQEDRQRVALCPAPFVEGAMAGALAAQAGLSLPEVAREAQNALRGKQSDLPGADSGALRESAMRVHAGMERRCYELSDPAGLHLRPAAELVRVAGEAGMDFWIGRSAVDSPLVAGKSLSGLLALELRQGEAFCVYSNEPLASDLLTRLDSLFGSSAEALPEGRPQGAVPGFALGLVADARLRLEELLPTAEAAIPDGVERLRRAIAVVGSREHEEGILDAQRALLVDPRLQEKVDAEFRRGQGPAHAWVTAVEGLAQEIERLHEPLLRARAADWRDLGRQVLEALLGDQEGRTFAEARPSILLVDDLLPSMAATMDPAQVLGVIDRHGAPNSHAAILLRGAGIPYVINVRAPELRAGIEVAMDGATGEVIVAPQKAQVEAIRARYATAEPLTLPDGFAGDLALADGSHVEFWANVASPAEAQEARRLGARGIGLLRTEFLYLDRWQSPNEEEQMQHVQKILAPMAGRRSVVRLLDAGADKPLPFLNLPREENPALGLRGIRALLACPEFLQVHLRAILRAGHGQDIALMAPMVSQAQEIIELRRVLASCHSALLEQHIDHAWPVALGIMAEVPAMLLESGSFRGLVDFVSVGTNDLTQYVFAADRGDERLQNLGGAGSPAVLGLIQGLLQGLDVPVSVCGEAAGSPQLALALVGHGIRRLSMSPRSFASVWQALRVA